MHVPLASLLLPLLMASAARAEDPGMAVIPMFAQQIVLRQPDGWDVAYLYEDSSTSLAKFVPADQTLFDWREILSVEAYRGIGLHPSYGPETMLKAIREEYAAHCSQTLVTDPVEARFINGYTNAAMLLTCPALAADFDGGTAGEGIAGLFIAIKGRQDLYVVHYSIRATRFDPAHPPLTVAGYRDYLGLIEPLLLCETGDSIADCLAHRQPH